MGPDRYRTAVRSPALNAALAGLTFTPPAGFHVVTTLTLGCRVVRRQSHPGPGLDHRRRLRGDDDGRQRPGLAPPGDPRFQRRHGRDEYDRLRHPRRRRPDDRTRHAPARRSPTSVLIDGTTQPGYAGTPLIDLTGRRWAAPTRCRSPVGHRARRGDRRLRPRCGCAPDVLTSRRCHGPAAGSTSGAIVPTSSWRPAMRT